MPVLGRVREAARLFSCNKLRVTEEKPGDLISW